MHSIFQRCNAWREDSGVKKDQQSILGAMVPATLIVGRAAVQSTNADRCIVAEKGRRFRGIVPFFRTVGLTATKQMKFVLVPHLGLKFGLQISRLGARPGYLPL